ncbi:hypothetical protein PbB2_01202 [Candidatus Phycosocius bacilliformis]|uniref:Uncharacterized protein n=1 Tax=Candidatus Phycosocius bacilliformis TaxID=1445552 RepID=A0A2P2E8Z8_9PROT|nr:hypothetical protein [Candidatus Phycosocius bacilliformis]GBF57535.1 hypothetical protein PbB2_01202 [Candidatus Phycosocius bacilliformis]
MRVRSLAFGLVLLGPAEALAQSSDYVRFQAASADACATACSGDRMCASWSFGKPAAPSPAGLVDRLVPPASAKMCTLSSSRNQVQMGGQRGGIQSGLPRRLAQSPNNLPHASGGAAYEVRPAPWLNPSGKAANPVTAQTPWSNNPGTSAPMSLAPSMAPPVTHAPTPRGPNLAQALAAPQPQTAPAARGTPRGEPSAPAKPQTGPFAANNPPNRPPQASASVQAPASQTTAPTFAIPVGSQTVATQGPPSQSAAPNPAPAPPLPVQSQVVRPSPPQPATSPAPTMTWDPRPEQTQVAPDAAEAYSEQKSVRQPIFVPSPPEPEQPSPAAVSKPPTPAPSRPAAVTPKPQATRATPVRPAPPPPPRAVSSAGQAPVPVPAPATQPTSDVPAQAQPQRPAQAQAQGQSQASAPVQSSPPVSQNGLPDLSQFRGPDGMIDAAAMRRAQLNAARDKGQPAYAVQREWEAVEAERQRAAATGEVRPDPLAGTVPVAIPEPERPKATRVERPPTQEPAPDPFYQEDETDAQPAPKPASKSKGARGTPRAEGLTKAQQKSLADAARRRASNPAYIDREPRLGGGPGG